MVAAGDTGLFSSCGFLGQLLGPLMEYTVIFHIETTSRDAREALHV